MLKTIQLLLLAKKLLVTRRIIKTTDFPIVSCFVLQPASGGLNLSTTVRPSRLYQNKPCTGISTCFPSLTPIGLSLGPTHPWMTNIARETLGFRWSPFSGDFRYSYRHTHFCTLQ